MTTLSSEAERLADRCEDLASIFDAWSPEAYREAAALLRRIPELEAGMQEQAEKIKQQALQIISLDGQAQVLQEERDRLSAELAGRWRPIETAPKDGRPVLVAPGLWNGFNCSLATYDNDKYASKPRPYWSRLDDHGKVTYSRQNPPTHWMPLPPPPATQGSEE